MFLLSGNTSSDACKTCFNELAICCVASLLCGRGIHQSIALLLNMKRLITSLALVGPLLFAAQQAEASWEYHSSVDKMRGTTASFASVESENQVQFDFPYNGGSRATITVRSRQEDGLSVMLRVSKGQFTCFMGCTVAVKFDDGKVQNFSATGTDSGDSAVLFIESEKRFVAALLKSKRTIIEAPFFQTGRRQFEFNTSGLTWPVPQASSKK